jgi:hypothetical protein
MISSKYFNDKLDAIRLDNISNIKYEKEPVFNVSLNTRKIEKNPAFGTLGTKGELDIETIWFASDRYFDGRDLSKDIWAVQAVNAIGEGYLFPITFVYSSDNINNIESDLKLLFEKNENDGKKIILLGFKIPYDLTKEPGDIKLSLKCYSYKDNVDKNEKKILATSLNTNTITLKIEDTLNFSSENNSIPTYPQETKLEEIVKMIHSVYFNEQITSLDYSKISEETLPNINGIVTLNSGENTLKYSDLKELPEYIINDQKLEPGVSLKLLTEADAVLSEGSTNPIQNQAVFKRFGEVEEDFTVVRDSIAKLATKLEGITFAKLEILNFSCEPQLAEIGTKVENILFKWKMNKISKNISILQGDNVIAEIEDLESEEFSLQSSFEENTIFTLKAEDINNTFAVAESKLVFTNKVYYGAKEESQSYNWSFVESLSNNQLQTSYESSFEISVGENQYVYYVVPTEYGVTDKNFFAYGGSAPGGFISVGTVDREYGDNGKKVNYTIWRSSYPNLGQDFNLTIK